MRITIVILLAVGLSACGFKGSLYLPEAPPSSQKNEYSAAPQLPDHAPTSQPHILDEDTAL